MLGFGRAAPNSFDYSAEYEQNTNR